MACGCSDAFKEAVLPKVLGWFGSSDKSLRNCLMENMGEFIEQCDDAAVSEKIFPAICGIFADPEPGLRMNSVKTVPGLIGKLTDHQINHVRMRTCNRAHSKCNASRILRI